jgi:hypothetical protein
MGFGEKCMTSKLRKEFVYGTDGRDLRNSGTTN